MLSYSQPFFLKLLQGRQSLQTSVESEIKCQQIQAFPLKFYCKPMSHSPHTHLPLPYPGSVEHWGRVCFNHHCHQWFGWCILRILVCKGNQIPIFAGIKQYIRMVVLKDFPYNTALVGNVGWGQESTTTYENQAVYRNLGLQHNGNQFLYCFTGKHREDETK